MTITIHVAVRAAEAILRAADIGHTSGAVLIFLRLLSSSGPIEAWMGILSLLALLLLMWDAIRYVRKHFR